MEAGEGEELEEDRRALLSLEQNIGRTPEMNFSSIISRCLVYHGPRSEATISTLLASFLTALLIL